MIITCKDPMVSLGYQDILYEIENGKLILNYDPPRLRPVTDYMKPQGRFRHLTPDTIETIQSRVTKEYEKLKEKAELVTEALQW